jgi:acyl carrier protein
MGLDGVELVISIEEEFGVIIPDAAAERMETPRGIIDWLMERLEEIGSGKCLSQRGFYKLRRALMAEANLPRATIRPETPLDELLPRNIRRKIWKKLRVAPSLRPLQNLRRPRALARLIGAAVFAAAIGVWILSVPTHGFASGGAIGLLAAGFMAALAHWLTIPFATCLPRGIHTIGDTAKSLEFGRVEAGLRSGGRTPREVIAERVKELVIEQLGIKASIYHEDASFVRDFGF